MAEIERSKTGQSFYFIGENLALDLVNTEAVKRRKRQDLLATPEDVQYWWQAAKQHHPHMDEVRGESEGDLTIYDETLIHGLKVLRKSLRAIINALVDEQPPGREDLGIVNDIYKTGYVELELTLGDNLYTRYHTTDEHKGRVLLPIALSALHLIQGGERKRLHRCSNEHCILFFYDTTRSATRRWCSLECMDRARSSERYKQAKEQAAH